MFCALLRRYNVCKLNEKYPLDKSGVRLGAQTRQDVACIYNFPPVYSCQCFASLRNFYPKFILFFALNNWRILCYILYTGVGCEENHSWYKKTFSMA